MDSNRFTPIRLDNKPPRPLSGTGDIAMQFGPAGQEVVLKWEDGLLKDVFLPEGSSNIVMFAASFEEMLPDGSTTGIVVCRKCAKDTTTGQEVCWDVPC